jgi:putative endonuclease
VTLAICDGRYGLLRLHPRKPAARHTGITNDLGRRMQEHRLGRGSEFVKQHGINRLVHVEPFEDVQDAIRREKQLKKWKRDWKIELIEKENLDWRDLSDLIVDSSLK